MMKEHLIQNGLLPEVLESVILFSDDSVWYEPFMDLIPVDFLFVRFMSLQYFKLVFSNTILGFPE